MSLSRKFRYAFVLPLLVAAVATLVVAGWYSGWLGQIVLQGMILASDGTKKAFRLEDYRVGIDALPIEGVAANASGLTYHPQRNSLFLVVNRPPQIVELNLDGSLRRRIAVTGVADPEGITYVEGDRFFVADEALQQLILLEIADDQLAVDAGGRPRIGLAFDFVENRGFEGVSWDHVRDRLFVVQEKYPLRLLELEGLPDFLDRQRLDLQIREWIPQWIVAFFLRDLSSLSYHEASESMLLLSDESRLIVELNAEKRPSGMLVLRKGQHGLKNDVPQAEGVAVGPNGAIYVISEPNLFYRFDPPHR